MSWLMVLLLLMVNTLSLIYCLTMAVFLTLVDLVPILVLTKGNNITHCILKQEKNFFFASWWRAGI